MLIKSKNGLSKGLLLLFVIMLAASLAIGCSSPVGVDIDPTEEDGGDSGDENTEDTDDENTEDEGEDTDEDDPASLVTYLASLQVAEGQLEPDFTKETLAYSVDVDNSVDEVTISASPEADEAVADITPSDRSLSVGENVFTITVTNDTQERDYTITVTRAEQVASDNANLSSLSISNGTLDFSAAQTSYEVNVANSVESIELTAVAAHAEAQVSGSGTHGLQVGENPIDVVVTAEDGSTTKTYSVLVNRAQEGASDNADLASLSLSAGGEAIAIDPVFDSGTLSYTAEVANGVGSVDVAAVADDDDASVAGTGSKSLDTGANPLDVVVTAADGSDQTYTIVVDRAEPGTADIEIIPAPGVITITFSGNQDQLLLNNSMTVTATPSESVDSYSWYINGESVGSDSNEITLTAGTTAGEYGVGTYRVDLQVAEGTRLASEHFMFTVSDQELDPVAAPVLTPGTANVTTGATIDFTSSTSGAIFHYTIDGTTPTTDSPSGTSVTLSGAVSDEITVKVLAVKDGMADSQIVAESYTIVEEPESVRIYFEAGTQPTIWLWEVEGVAITADMGYSWENQPAMTDAGDGWWYFEIPAAYYPLDKDLGMKFNSSDPEISLSGPVEGHNWYNGTWYTSKP